jgi:ribosomal protein S18 acetylase RimI-like enzyme
MTLHIRRIRVDDWELARCVRLAALAEAPDSFASTLAEEQAMPDRIWRERALSNAAGTSTIGFLAVLDDVACGIVVGVLSEDARSVVLNALWVVATARRRGIARALVHAVLAWAQERRAEAVTLEVTTVSRAAIALYRSLGFEPLAEAGECGARCAPALRMRKALSYV